VKSSYIPPHQERLEKAKTLSGIQQGLEKKEVTEMLLIQEKEAYQQLHYSLHREEEHWILKSRSLRLKAGDSNISFHKQAQNRRKKIQLHVSFQTLGNDLMPSNKLHKQLLNTLNLFINNQSKKDQMKTHENCAEISQTSSLNMTTLSKLRRYMKRKSSKWCGIWT
jgi:hypothetical protein